MTKVCRWEPTCRLPAGDKAPSFAVWAVKDPTSGNLDRIQIVKGWTGSGQSFEKVFDVAWAGDREPDKLTGVVPSIGSTVDIEKATYTNTIGAVELKKRVDRSRIRSGPLGVLLCACARDSDAALDDDPGAQLGMAPPGVVARLFQERAWSSPIWYTPTAGARSIAKDGPTVNDLRKQGAVALNDAQFTALIVGKSPWLQNNVTGTKFKITSSTSGVANATQTLTPIDPRYVTSKLSPKPGQALIDHAGRRFDPTERRR